MIDCPTPHYLYILNRYIGIWPWNTSFLLVERLPWATENTRVSIRVTVYLAGRISSVCAWATWRAVFGFTFLIYTIHVNYVQTLFTFKSHMKYYYCKCDTMFDWLVAIFILMRLEVVSPTTKCTNVITPINRIIAIISTHQDCVNLYIEMQSIFLFFFYCQKRCQKR